MPKGTFASYEVLQSARDPQPFTGSEPPKDYAPLLAICRQMLEQDGCLYAWTYGVGRVYCRHCGLKPAAGHEQNCIVAALERELARLEGE